MRKYFLTTSRIGFSTWKEKDLPLALSLWGQPEVSQYVSVSGKFSNEEIEERLKFEMSNFENYKIQYFPFFDLETEEFIGCCGLKPFNIENKIYETGFYLKKEFWHKGLAKEAFGAIIEYSFNKLKAKELRAGHHPLNDASKNLLKKMNFQYFQDSYYEPTNLLHPLYYLKNE
ncbi:GNAT family N-acetyltransferase [Spiroplasma chinense]|uniref:GNAT family N-acetyltransferase n=1 Tax=Spiroplasma chinense TaxID=216932 RepID=A0A5B9Y548_9MOLU|nr:GNAT family N-acetyltransferase [Spiroplasma chinense]QEH62224.1 GNAT family N-acetyltransferase [Spiroplasma chinense]